MFSLAVFGNIQIGFSPRVGQMKNFPAAITFKKLERINTTVGKPVACIKSIVAPGLRKTSVNLNFETPDLFVPDFLVWLSNSNDKVGHRAFLIKNVFAFFVDDNSG